MKICVLQTDNRPTLDYLLKTQAVNKQFCSFLQYEYLFLTLESGNIHPATQKIHIVHDFLQKNTCDILVFLDSDAWIQNGYWLKDIIDSLKSDCHGCFSREPYAKKNTFINSGSFILKNNEFTKQMYTDLLTHLDSDSTYHNVWPFDQYYISNYVFEHKKKFTIFTPDVLNTPFGQVLRHNWFKNKKMYDDLDTLLSCKIFPKLPYTASYDTQEFPNTMVYHISPYAC